ncbi:MAG: sulfite exporter TauE/SafE family protein [Fimbriimonas sp.]
MAGAVASGVNSVAGGGSLVSFPTLHLGMGIPAIPANATNAVSLWPGSFAAAFSGREHLAEVKAQFHRMILPTVVGSVLGSLLLSLTPQNVFDVLVPLLIVLAAVVLLLQPRIKAWATERSLAHAKPVVSPLLGLTIQFLVALYGGYFGAGMGILMLGAFAISMDATFHQINAVKNALAVLINATATVVFVYQRLVLWAPLVALASGALVGGYAIGRISQRLDPDKLRIGISVYGFVMAGYLAFKAFH